MAKYEGGMGEKGLEVLAKGSFHHEPLHFKMLSCGKDGLRIIY